MQLIAGRIFRGVTGVMAFGAAFYIVGYFFSWSNSPSRWLSLWLIAAAINLPLALIPGLGLSLRRGFMRAGMIVCVASILALGWLHVEAQMLLAPAIAQNDSGYEQRHWPFSNSSVHFVPGQGIFWQD